MAKNNVDEQLSSNDFRLSLVRLVGPALIALITLGQLGGANRFDVKGPTWLDPASLSTLVACGFVFALYYGNIGYASTQLRNRLSLAEDKPKRVKGTDPVPSDVSRRVWCALFQYIIGFALLLATVGFFLGFLWT